MTIDYIEIKSTRLTNKPAPPCDLDPVALTQATALVRRDSRWVGSDIQFGCRAALLSILWPWASHDQASRWLDNWPQEARDVVNLHAIVWLGSWRAEHRAWVDGDQDILNDGARAAVSALADVTAVGRRCKGRLEPVALILGPALTDLRRGLDTVTATWSDGQTTTCALPYALDPNAIANALRRINVN